MSSRMTHIVRIEGTLEYFYSLAAMSFFNVSAVQFLKQVCEGNTVIINSVLRRSSINGGPKPVALDMTFTFNETNGLIYKIDAHFLNPGQAFDLPPSYNPIIFKIFAT